VRTDGNHLKLKFPLAGTFSRARIGGGYRFGDHWQNEYCGDVGEQGNRLLHNGTDFSATDGQVVFAVGDCAVKYAEANDEAGGFIVLEHPEGYTITYTHVL